MKFSLHSVLSFAIFSTVELYCERMAFIIFSNASNLFSSIQITNYLSAAAPDFIQVSTSLILNFHSLPIFVAGISLLAIQASTVSRLTPRYSQISFIEYQRSMLESILKPHFQVDLLIHNSYTIIFI